MKDIKDFNEQERQIYQRGIIDGRVGLLKEQAEQSRQEWEKLSKQIEKELNSLGG